MHYYRSRVFSRKTFNTLPKITLTTGVKTLSDLPKEGWFLAPVFCQDLLFSGHAILNVLCSCFLFQFPMIRSSPILKSLLLFYTTFSCFWSIILRNHYTVDVIVSTLLTLFLFLNKIEKVRYYAAGKLKINRVKKILEGLCHIAILIVIGPVAFIVDKLKTMLYKVSSVENDVCLLFKFNTPQRSN